MQFPSARYVPNRPHDRNAPNAPNLRSYDRPIVHQVPNIPPESGSKEEDVPVTDRNLLNTRDMSQIARPVSVLVDSRDRDYHAHPHPHKYSIRLPHTLRNVTHARLMSCEMPASFYVFQDTHGTTGMRVSVEETVRNVFVSEGNYSFSTMSKELEKRLEEAFPTFAFQVKFDDVTQRCRFHVSLNETPVSSFTIDTTDDARMQTSRAINRSKETGWGLAYFLGFERDAVHESTDGTLEGTRPAIVFPENYILLDIRGLGKVQEAGLFGEQEARHTFAKIPINAPWPYALSTWSQVVQTNTISPGVNPPSTFPSVYWDKQITTNTITPPILELDVLHVEFRFHDRTPVDFHSFEHSMTLEFLVSEIQTY